MTSCMPYDDPMMMKFLPMLLVCLFYGGSVRNEDGQFDDIKEEELEMFDDPPSFIDLVLRVKENFDGDSTLKRRFDSGKTRAHFVIMPLQNQGHWSQYLWVI